MPRPYEHKTTSVFLLNYHIVWIPKRRGKPLVGRVRTRLNEFGRRLNWLPTLWTRSYFVSTAGNVSATAIEKYIAEQRTNWP